MDVIYVDVIKSCDAQLGMWCTMSVMVLPFYYTRCSIGRRTDTDIYRILQSYQVSGGEDLSAARFGRQRIKNQGFISLTNKRNCQCHLRRGVDVES